MQADGRTDIEERFHLLGLMGRDIIEDHTASDIRGSVRAGGLLADAPGSTISIQISDGR